MAESYDPLRDACRRLLDAWDSEDYQERNDLSEDFWHAVGWLDAVMKGWKQEVPEVEVTDTRSARCPDCGAVYVQNHTCGSSVPAQDRSSLHVVAPERPLEARRSGAKNVSAPRLQSAFIEEARASMGQSSEKTARRLLGKRVRLVFNVDKPPVEGVLTRVINHPASAPTYLVLDDKEEVRYSLNAIQEIQRAPG